MRWKELNQMLCNGNRANARTAASVRNGECFVQIQVANVGSNAARIGQPNLSVHVSAVHINLSAMRMNNLAQFGDRRLINSVSRWISHHETRQGILEFFSF